MLVQAEHPSARRAVHMILTGEPELGRYRTLRGVRLVPVEDLIRMKLSSFRLKDQMHLKDLEQAGLITKALQESLSPVHRERLAAVQAAE